MGKIRIKTLGSDQEKAQKEHDKIRREEKKKRLTHLAGMKGGEKVVDMSATAPEAPEAPAEAVKEQSGIVTTEARSRIEEIGSQTQVKGKKKTSHQRGQAYLTAKKLIEPGKLYPVGEALILLKKISLAHFDGSVEIHLNTTEKGLRGQVSFPHSTGRQVRVAIADDLLLETISHGKIDFDILVASPAMMPKLVKFAKILGPKGLMPNPKNGTISDQPQELAKKLSTGQVQFKTEAEAPIIHLVIGKVSFPAKNLEENLNAFLEAVGTNKIVSAFLKSTMSPAIRIQI